MTLEHVLFVYVIGVLIITPFVAAFVDIGFPIAKAAFVVVAWPIVAVAVVVRGAIEFVNDFRI